MLKKPPNKKPKDKKPAGEKQTKTKPINEKPAKRIGRPAAPVRAGQRYQIGLTVPGETKNILVKRAKESGRTIAREFMILIERALLDEERYKAMGMTLDNMEKGNFEATLFRLGYTPIRTMAGGKSWKMWAEPGFPGIQRSGFVPWEEGEEPKWEQPE
jgi:hypothetical protein